MTTLAILGGEPIRTEPYPDWPEFDERDIQAVTDVIRSGRWGGFPYPGPQTSQFIDKFLEMQGGEYAVAMMNGTVTIEVALRAAGIGWEDEVIVPALTFQATAAAPMAAGAIPVIVDVDPQTYCIDPAAIRKAITPRTRAIIPVHLGAQMADMDAIMQIAAEHNLVVVEDCAHAHGARWRGQGAGTIGHFGSFSLQSSKILTTGEGGLLVCRTQELMETAASISICGRPVDAEGKRFTMGANYRMSEMQSALGVVALERFPDQMHKRNEMANYLEEGLSTIPGVRILRRDQRLTRRSIYMYGLAIDPSAYGVYNKVLCAALEAEGIPCGTGYAPLHQCDLFQPGLSRLPVPSALPERFDFATMHFPAAERAAEEESVWLSQEVFLEGQKGIDSVVDALQKVQANANLLTEVARLNGLGIE